MPLLILLLVSLSFGLGGAPLESGEPIPVGAGSRRGPLSVGTNNFPLGTARVTGGAQPDLFVVAGNHSPVKGLFLCPFVAAGPDGRPVFGAPRPVGYPDADPKTYPVGQIWQQGESIEALFLVKKALIHAVFDRAANAFVARSRSTFPGAVPTAVAVTGRPGGGWELALAIPEPRAAAGDGIDSRDPRYRPYDGGGIWRFGLGYVGLWGLTVERLPEGPLPAPHRLANDPRQVLDRNLGLAPARWGNESGLVSGGWYGDVVYYDRRGEGWSPRGLAVGPDGNGLRHPIPGFTPCAWPNAVSGSTDLIAGGEGALYWYRFTGKRGPSGPPAFAAPAPVEQQNAALYAGTLPVPTITDWDGDGALDIVAGNSEGRILFFRNTGTSAAPAFAEGVALAAGGREIEVQSGYRGSVQGPGEARWGYVSPNVFDWNADGQPDILMGDALSRHTVFLNRGSRRAPRLDPERPLYLDGLDLHGTWRVRPGVGKLGGRVAYVINDDDDQFHLYWRLDDFHVTDGGKLRMEDGGLITANFIYAGGTGRSKIELVDWDEDGKTDLLVGTPRHHSIPNPETGLPRKLGLPGATVLFLKNVGTNEEPRFRFPVVMKHRGQPMYIGHHEIGVSAGRLGGDRLNLVVSREDGRLFFFDRRELDWGQ